MSSLLQVNWYLTTFLLRYPFFILPYSSFLTKPEHNGILRSKEFDHIQNPFPYGGEGMGKRGEFLIL